MLRTDNVILYITVFTIVFITGCADENDAPYMEPGPPVFNADTVDLPLERFNEEDIMSLPGEKIEITRVRQPELPGEVSSWFHNARRLDAMPVAISKVHDDKTYLYASWGMRPTGGYAVTILGAIQKDDEIIVRVGFRRPGPEDMVTQAFTHPFDIAAIPVTEYPVRFTIDRTDYPRTLSTIRGIEDLKEIVAESRLIKVFSPGPNTAVNRDFEVTGIANVFEATVQYRVRGDEDTIIYEGFTTASAAIDWGYFSFNVSLNDLDRIPDEVTLELYWIDAEDGSERDMVIIPLRQR